MICVKKLTFCNSACCTITVLLYCFGLRLYRISQCIFLHSVCNLTLFEFKIYMALCDCWDKTFTFLHDHLWKIMAKSTNEGVSGYSMYIRFSFLVQKVRCVENKLMVVVGRWRHEAAQRLGSIPTILKYIPTQSQLDM